MCGIGTSLIEAVHQGRDAIGIEYEPEWAELARANLDYAADRGASGAAHVVGGDARVTAWAAIAGSILPGWLRLSGR